MHVAGSYHGLALHRNLIPLLGALCAAHARVKLDGIRHWQYRVLSPFLVRRDDGEVAGLAARDPGSPVFPHDAVRCLPVPATGPEEPVSTEEAAHRGGGVNAAVECPGSYGVRPGIAVPEYADAVGIDA